MYNDQALNLKNKKSCVGNGKLFYFSDDKKIHLLHIQRQSVENEYSSDMFVE